MIGKLFYRIGSELFPQGPRFAPGSKDTMLVSYPKSGNTWMRALVSHLISKQPSLGHIEQLVPDVYKSKARALRNAYRFPCSGRLIKSHESFNPSYKRVIYLARDPRDVCVSYYHYLSTILPKVNTDAVSLDIFFDRYLSGGLDDYGTWGEHVATWLAAENAEFLLVRFEDMLSHPAASLTRVSDFLGLDVPDSAIISAVEECSIDNLRRKEKTERSTWQQMSTAKSFSSFFREGKSGNWSALKGSMIDMICQKWSVQMKTLDYI